MAALPTNSSITIDGITLNTNASAVMLWEAAVEAAISEGATRWVRFRNNEGLHSVLVHPGSTVSTFIGQGDVRADGENLLERSPVWNLASWVEKYIDPSSNLWNIAESIGVVAEIETKDTGKDAQQE